jgi:GTP-binding protein
MNTTTAKFLLGAPDLASCPDDTLPEFAFAGRSNVGKSSLLNLLVGKRDLANVSATPGHTKQINFFTINDSWRLVDLPGYGYAHVERKERSRFNESVAEYLRDRENLALVFALVDASLPPQPIDLEFIEGLIDYEVPFVLVFTKTDRVSSDKLREHIDALRTKLAEWCKTPPEIFTCSAVNRQGRHAILSLIESILTPEQRQRPGPKPPRRNTPW